MEHNRGQPKFYSTSEYVDLETGEIITKYQFELEYYKVRSSYKTEKNEYYIIKKYTHECRRNKQYDLFGNN